jgi:hypothetical protein
LTKNMSQPVLNQLFTVRTPEPKQDAGVDTRQTKKSLLFTILNPKSRQWQAVWFKYFLSVVIIFDLVVFIIRSEPDLREEDIAFFHTTEGVTSTIFLIEYLARLCTVTENKKYGDLGAIRGRIHYSVTFPALIDALATIPFFLEEVTGFELPQLTFLRTFRLLRILKTNGMVKATDAVWRVVYYNSTILYVAFLVCLLLILITSILMYYLRPRNTDNVKGTRKNVSLRLAPAAGKLFVTILLSHTCIRLSVYCRYNVPIYTHAYRPRRTRRRLAVVYKGCSAFNWRF